MSRRVAGTLVVWLAGALVVTLTACSGPTERPVTTEEAQRLAVARLSVYDERSVDLTMDVPVGGQTLHLAGRADLRAHEAYAVVTTGDSPPRHALLQWTLDGKAIVEVPQVTVADGPPDPPPAQGWQAAGLDPADALDSALAIALNLASDRAENPLLLQRNGARWVGTDRVHGTDVDVFTAPGEDAKPNDAIRYYVDDAGTLHRMTADTGADDLLVVDLAPSADRDPIPLVEELAP